MTKNPLCRFHLRVLPLALGAFFVLTSCSSLWKEYDASQFENKEFAENVKVTEIAPAGDPAAATAPAVVTKAPSPVGTGPVGSGQPAAANKKTAKSGKTKAASAATPAAPVGPLKHEPSLEDGEGFDGRRPLVDPFKENEKLSYSVTYFGAEGGKFTTTIGPFVQVNGKKAYQILYTARSSSVFSLFYTVDDRAETFIDYEALVPYSYTITARESKQVRDVKNYFNWQTMKVKHWDKKLKKGAKVAEEKNLVWDLVPYSQNVFSVPFYLRTFTFAVGKEFAVRVAHDGKNIIMRAKVLREEKVSTGAGKFDAWVVKPEFEINGVFKPVGDIFMWLKKDDSKILLKIESKIKIGTVAATLEKIGP